MKKIAFFICCLWSFAVHGQIRKIQWASSLEYQHNQYEEDHYSGVQAIGPPDAFPPGHINRNAFRLSGVAEFGTVKLGFTRPHPVQQVIIIENNHPGRISQVKLIDELGLTYIIYEQAPQRIADKFRAMVLSVPRTDYNVKSIEISLNSIAAPGYSQIDAVGILENGDLSDVRNLLSGANFNVQQVFTLTAEKERLHPQINSRYTEAKPLVSHNGRELYFSRLFYPENVGGKSDQQDIYVSNFINGQWTEAKNIGVPLNDEFANGVCSISPDGNKLLLINGYLADGSITPGVSMSIKTAIGWGEPMKIDIKGFENHSEFQDYFLSADERVIIMAIENHKGYGDQDLFVSQKIGDKQYSAPISLGPVINTRHAEFAPFLSPDNTTLYFASDGHKGYGKSDIYKTKRLDNSWSSWTEPQNLGPAVNTASWEAYFSVTAAGDYAYFVSSEGSRKGEENIYRIPLLQDPSMVKPHSLLAFQGRIFDAVTHEPVSASIILPSKEQTPLVRTTSDKHTGNFLCYIPPDTAYTFTIKAAGYLTAVEQVSFGSSSGESRIYRNIFLISNYDKAY